MRRTPAQRFLELAAFHGFVRASWHKLEVITAQNQATASSPAAFHNECLQGALDRLRR